MLQTVTGPISEHEAGTMLVHEHILVGFVEDGKLTPANYDRQEVIASILPLLLKLQHRIDSSMRATMGSFQSLGENVVLIFTGVGFGYFSSQLDIFGGYGFIAVLCSVFFVYFSFASKKVVE
jgi:predicted metal-dependent phosphotriesterase family hydrolase